MNTDKLRKLVIEHNIIAKHGEKFDPVIINAAQFGDDFDRHVGETHDYPDGMRGYTPVAFRQTFLITDETDQELMTRFGHKNTSTNTNPDRKMYLEQLEKTALACLKLEEITMQRDLLREALDGLVCNRYGASERARTALIATGASGQPTHDKLMTGQRYRDDSPHGGGEEFILSCLPQDGGRRKEYILINTKTGEPYTDPESTMIGAFGGDRNDFTLVSN